MAGPHRASRPPRGHVHRSRVSRPRSPRPARWQRATRAAASPRGRRPAGPRRALGGALRAGDGTAELRRRLPGGLEERDRPAHRALHHGGGLLRREPEFLGRPLPLLHEQEHVGGAGAGHRRQGVELGLGHLDHRARHREDRRRECDRVLVGRGPGADPGDALPDTDRRVRQRPDDPDALGYGRLHARGRGADGDADEDRPGARSSATSARRSAIMYGFTPTTTSPAPRTAVRFASGSVSLACASSPRARCAAADASDFVVRTTVDGSRPAARSPSRTAPDMEPTPSRAVRGSSMVMTPDPTDGLGSSVRPGLKGYP